jgi:hypothetical protein
MDTDYEALFTALYAYRFGHISFLELVEQLEYAFGLADQPEVPHRDVILLEREGD